MTMQSYRKRRAVLLEVPSHKSRLKGVNESLIFTVRVLVEM